MDKEQDKLKTSKPPEYNGYICKAACERFRDGKGSISRLPGLIKEIIEGKAWERREHNGKIYELPSLLALVTEKPLAGWGQDPAMVERLLKDDAEVLQMWRKETTRASHRPLKSDNNIITSRKPVQGTSKAYTLQRLKEQNPDLYSQVVNGELSASAAAIMAGFQNVTVTVVDDPERAAKTLLKKFGDEWFKQMIEAAGIEPMAAKAKDQKAEPRAEAKPRKAPEKKRVSKPKTKPAKPAEAKPKIVINQDLEKLPMMAYQSWYKEQLEEDLEKNGCKDPLIAQQGSNILVDGYKRYEICERLKIPYHVQYDHYKSLEEMATGIVLRDAETLKQYYEPDHEPAYMAHLRHTVAATFESMGLSERSSMNACQGALKILGINDN